ncbi:5'-cyclic phosphodiesterase (Drosophila willistoni) [Cotesia congregata]|uniref:Phosphodiesterase n=1 Tax=Cotesia congregata TaxID=51543 RepID=A0A8J2E6B9_COTCN|nr:5'-cyclic phosphodiesterase (Drosophila willistoni) [Cotesia congregata]
MKISMIPRSPETPDKRECTLVSSSDSKGPLSETNTTAGNNNLYNTSDDKDAKEKAKKKTLCEETVYEFEEDGLTMERVGKYLESNPLVVEAWLRDKASNELKVKLLNTSLLKQQSSLIVRGQKSQESQPRKRNSVTTDLFQSWLASNSPIKRSKSPNRLSTSMSGRRAELTQLDEGELFMELIRDVANELDINVLCHKILVNVGLLTHADRGSLFLAKGPQDERYLVAKLFDVTQDTELEDAIQKANSEEIRIPFGVGIAGYVAQTKEIINIKDAYSDPRFNSKIDLRTGYKTTLILSMPICNYEGDVIGVAQIINKTNGSNEFTNRDIEVFKRYLTFCGIGIQNAQLFELSVLEYRRNQILLNLARSIFEEQNNLECLVTKIMTEAKELLKCERCLVYLLDLDCGEAGHLEKIVERPGKSVQEDRKPLSRRESNNIDMEDILSRQALASDGSSKFTMVFEMENGVQEARVSRPSVSELASPLGRIARYVASTGQILNIGDAAIWLRKGVIDQSKEPIKSILCMPIVNGQRSVIGVAQLINKDNGSSFTDSDVSIFEAFAIFCGLGIHNTQMYESACKLMAKQKVALEPVKYHNWRHALNVAQTMFAMLKTGKMEQFMTDLEILGLLVACLCHDLDHRGTNNAFQTKTESPLAILYSTSTMEHHHFDQCVMILNSDSNNIFQTLSMEDYRRVMKVVESAILSTDLAVYFKKKNKFMELIDDGEFDWQSEEKKELLCGMMMTACDVSAIAKPWDVQHRVAKLVADEFFDQGDLEKLQLNQQPVAMMDRERRDELPQMQVGFIDVICLPLYKVLSETFPWIMPLYEGTTENRRNWQDLAEKVEMGLTWIDRDTIEEPVEEFVSQEPKDIEFTVTTLNCTTATPGTAKEFPKTALGRFASLRKGGRSLGKGVRHRLSKSLYTRNNSEDTGKVKVMLPDRKSNKNKLCLLI